MKKFRLHLPKRRAFTLIELLLYIGIFTIIITSIIGFLILATSERVKNQATADLSYQGEAVMAELTQAVHSASAINSPAAGAAASSLNLATASPATNPTIFDTHTDTTTTRWRITEGTPGTSYDLTNSHVLVSGVSFTNVGVSGSSGSVKIQFTLTYVNPSGRNELSVSKTFYGAASRP